VITALDTNVLVDILEPDPRYGAASGTAGFTEVASTI